LQNRVLGVYLQDPDDEDDDLADVPTYVERRD
jgi:hypothetical protein